MKYDNKTRDELISIIEDFEKSLDKCKYERIEFAQSLEESSLRYSQLFNTINTGAIVYKAVDKGKDFIFVEINKAAQRIDSMKKEKIIGKRITEVFPNVQEFGLLGVLYHVWETGVSQILPLSYYKDSRIEGWRKNYVYRLPSGEVVAIYEDATEQKKSEEALRESESHFKKLVSNVPGVVCQFYMSPDGFMSFSFVSNRSISSLKLSPEVIKQNANSFLDLIHLEDRESFYHIIAESGKSMLPCSWEGRLSIEGKEKIFQFYIELINF